MAVTEGKVAVTEGSGKNLATSTVTTSQGTVEREEVVFADPETPGARTRITSAAPAAADFGSVVRLPDGGDVAQGATTDAEAIDNGSEIAVLKRLRTIETGIADVLERLLVQAQTQTALLRLIATSQVDDVPDELMEDTLSPN